MKDLLPINHSIFGKVYRNTASDETLLIKEITPTLNK